MDPLFLLLLPWIIFLVFVLFAFKLIEWAKKRKPAAIALGIAAQILLPDPNVQKAQIVIEQQKKEIRQTQEAKDKKD